MFKDSIYKNNLKLKKAAEKIINENEFRKTKKTNFKKYIFKKIREIRLTRNARSDQISNSFRN